MYYIYTLSFNGIPFYVGMSKQPYKRYREHYVFSDCKPYNYVRYNLMTFGKLATMDIILCAESFKEAIDIEAKCIFSLYKAGFILLNTAHNYVHSFLPTKALLPPVYEHFNKLPYKWFTNKISDPIKLQCENILKEYEQHKLRHINMDNSISLS